MTLKMPTMEQIRDFGISNTALFSGETTHELIAQLRDSLIKKDIRIRELENQLELAKFNAVQLAAISAEALGKGN